MAQTPPDQNFYHHHSHPQLQLPPQFRNPFDLLFDERTGAINYNYIHPYIPNQLSKPDDLTDSLVMRRPRRTRTTFTSAQIAELEQHFLQARYLTSSRLAELSAKLALGTAQVKIWFKNRRRRHKIQSDQQKDQQEQHDQHSMSFSCDGGGMPLSAIVKSEPGTSAAPHPPPAPAPAPAPNLKALSLGSSGGSTPTTLTPSPTPTTPTAGSGGGAANHVDHYASTAGVGGGGGGVDSFNPYYYGSQQGGVYHSTVHGRVSAAAPQPSASLAATSVMQHQYPSTAVAQFYPPAPLQNQQQQQRQQHQQQRHHVHPQHHMQQQQQQLQQQLHQQSRHHQLQPQYVHPRRSPPPHPHQHYGDYQHKAQRGVVTGNARCVSAKGDPDFNYNNSSYYVRSFSAAARSAAVASVAMPLSAADGGGQVQRTSAMSPGSEVYEPLTPKNDESPSLCNGGSGIGNSGANNASSSVDMADDMDGSISKSIQVRVTNSIHHSRDNKDIYNGPMAFSKYNEPANYQCTMDTIMHAYNNHRNTSSNAQFAYCFN